jgi:hypothetical protein
MGRIVPSYLRTDYNGDLIGDCSELLRFRNIGVQTPLRRFSATAGAGEANKEKEAGGKVSDY